MRKLFPSLLYHRSSWLEMFCKKGVLRNFTKLWPLACNFIKKETLAQVFSCEFCEIAKHAFLTEHLRWLLLILVPTDALFLVNFLFLISYFLVCVRLFRSSHRRNSIKREAFLEILQNSLEPLSIRKATPTQLFSCEFCKICKNNLFCRTTPVAVFDVFLWFLVDE